MVTVVLAREDEDLVITCNTTTDRAVSWKFFNGDVLEDINIERYREENGKNLSLFKVGKPMLGEYSCWSKEEMLSSVYLLLAKESGEIFYSN